MQVLKDNENVSEEDITDIKIELLDKLKIDKEIELIMDNVIRALPPDQAASDVIRVNVEGALRSGMLQAWAITGNAASQKEEQLLGFATSQLRRDEFTQQKYMLIFSLNIVPRMSITAWKYMWDTIHIWGEKQDVHHAIAYTRNPRIVEMARAVGGTAETIEVYIPMGKIGG